MARLVRSKLETRSARLRLPGRREPYWIKLERGLSLGYHRPTGSGAGAWWGRIVVGGRYRIESLKTADDHIDGDGETVLDWRQAQAAVRTWAAKQTAGGPLTIAGACAAYAEDLRARKGAAAAVGVAGRLRKHLLPVLGDRRLADLTHREFLAWRNGMVNLDGDVDDVRRSRDSANRVLGMARAAFNLTGLDDRAWKRVKAFHGVGEARKVILTDTETQRLVDACGPGLRELVVIGAWTGARLGELKDRRVRDFDYHQATLSCLGKTGARDIQLPPPAVSLLRKLTSGKRPGDYLFATETGGRWASNTHSRRFDDAVRRAGLDPNTTFYALRHSYISRALVQGVPVGAVAAHCGTSVRMIERHYAKWIPSDQQRYAAMAAPPLRVGSVEKVVAIRPGAA
jgi:integrase